MSCIDWIWIRLVMSIVMHYPTQGITVLFSRATGNAILAITPKKRRDMSWGPARSPNHSSFFDLLLHCLTQFLSSPGVEQRGIVFNMTLGWWIRVFKMAPETFSEWCQDMGFRAMFDKECFQWCQCSWRPEYICQLLWDLEQGYYNMYNGWYSRVCYY